MSKSMILSFLKYVIPIYGDITIHKHFSKIRKENRKKLLEHPPNTQFLSEQKITAKKELETKVKELSQKYDVFIDIEKVESKERSNYERIKTQSTYIPEIIVLGTKYFGLISISHVTYYNFFC